MGTEESGKGEDATRCWAMTSGEIGMRNQAEGLAGMLDPHARSLTRGLARALAIVPPHWLFSPRGWFLGSGIWARLLLRSAGLTPPWPEVLVTCGRRSVAYSLAIRTISGGKTKTVHVQHPRVPLSNFDVVLLPGHDVGAKSVQDDNVVVMKGAMHHLALRDAKGEELEEAVPWSELPRPWFAVILGGKSRAYEITASDVSAMARALRTSLAIAGGGSVLIIPSRRTGETTSRELYGQLREVSHYFWDGADPNPYRAALALADVLCVTRDSVSMLSEACYTGKPVYLLKVSGQSERLARFHAALLDGNHARWLDAFDPAWTPNRLDEVDDAVEEISKKVGGRPAVTPGKPVGEALTT